MSRRWRNWCQNEVYEERKEADSRDKIVSKCNVCLSILDLNWSYYICYVMLFVYSE